MISETLWSRLLRKNAKDVDALLKMTLPALPDKDVADTIRISLISAFDARPEMSMVEVDTGSMSWADTSSASQQPEKTHKVSLDTA